MYYIFCFSCLKNDVDRQRERLGTADGAGERPSQARSAIFANIAGAQWACGQDIRLAYRRLVSRCQSQRCTYIYRKSRGERKRGVCPLCWSSVGETVERARHETVQTCSGGPLLRHQAHEALQQEKSTDQNYFRFENKEQSFEAHARALWELVVSQFLLNIFLSFFWIITYI